MSCMTTMTSGCGPRDRVSRLIDAALDSPAARHPSLSEVAGRLCMSTRTLKRRLRDSGVRYRQLLDEARLRRAARLLGATRLPLDAIADSVGYSSGANLSRAFRRWTGITPGSFRQQRGSEPAGVLV